MRKQAISITINKLNVTYLDKIAGDGKISDYINSLLNMDRLKHSNPNIEILNMELEEINKGLQDMSCKRDELEDKIFKSIREVKQSKVSAQHDSDELVEKRRVELIGKQAAREKLERALFDSLAKLQGMEAVVNAWKSVESLAGFDYRGFCDGNVEKLKSLNTLDWKHINIDDESVKASIYALNRLDRGVLLSFLKNIRDLWKELKEVENESSSE